MSRVVVVAGASSETGRAVCAALDAAGMTVVAVGSSAERLDSAAASARFECDLADAAAVAGLADRIRKEVGPVDGLIHLVGGWRRGQADEDFEWLERRLLTTLRNTSRAFRDDLGSSSAGRLAIVGSASALAPTWSNANHATLKSAAETWVLSLASGWRKGGTAAAVVFVVNSLGAEGTPPEVLAASVAGLWDKPAGELNGTRIRL